MTPTEALQAMLHQLREREDALTPWEQDFLTSIEAWPPDRLTLRQRDTLRAIHARLVTNPPGGLDSSEDELWR